MSAVDQDRASEGAGSEALVEDLARALRRIAYGEVLRPDVFARTVLEEVGL